MYRLSPGVQDQPGEHGKTLSLQKIKIVACTCSPSSQEAEAGGLLEPGEVKAAVSCDCTTALQPGWWSKTLSQEKKTLGMVSLEWLFCIELTLC